MHSQEEYSKSKFCKKCGAWLFIKPTLESMLEDLLKEAVPKRPADNGVQHRINDLCQKIDMYLNAFRKECPFNSEQLRLHVQTLTLRYELGSVNACLRNADFVESLYETLGAWGLMARGAKLLPFEEFREALLENENQISIFEDKRIDDGSLTVEEVADGLWDLIDRMRVSRAANPIVSGTKTLHHILPELVPPIDREYTRPFFRVWMQQFQNSPRTVFLRIWKNFVLISTRVNLREYVGRMSWNTSITKVIDNAIVGYCKYHNIPKLR